MEGTTFFEHYRISKQYDGESIEIGRVGPAIIYKAADLRTGAPVALTLLPVASVDGEARPQFEEKARSAQLLDHINIARIVAFGTADDQFAFVSELPQGETVAQWVAAHGPIPPDAVLRIALQVVSALGAGSFYGLTHPSIQPSNLVIVPGKTLEGGWPFVKLTNFGLAGLKVAADEKTEQAVVSEFASPEQLQNGTIDFRSEIYSLGATICFLLTGAFYSAEPRSLQTRRFAWPLRKLIAPMLRQNPDERPQDPVLFAQMLRACLQKVERRQAWQQKFGVPFVPVTARPPQNPALARAPQQVVEVRTESARPWLPRRTLAFGAILLASAAVAAALLPAPIGLILHRRDKAEIGVPVGVADASPGPTAPRTSTAAIPNPLPPHPGQSIAANTAANRSPGPSPARSVASDNQIASAAHAAATTSPLVNETGQNRAPMTQPGSTPVAKVSPSTPPTVAIARQPSPARETESAEETSEPQPPAQGPQTVWERAGGASGRAKISTEGEETERDPVPETEQPEERKNHAGDRVITSDPKTRAESREEASTTRRPSETTTTSRTRISPTSRDRLAANRRTFSGHSFRARYVGITPNGNLILQLPSGETTIVQPDHFPPYHGRRVIERRRVFVPPPPYGPPFLPGY